MIQKEKSIKIISLIYLVLTLILVHGVYNFFYIPRVLYEYGLIINTIWFLVYLFFVVCLFFLDETIRKIFVVYQIFVIALRIMVPFTLAFINKPSSFADFIDGFIYGVSYPYRPLNLFGMPIVPIAIFINVFYLFFFNHPSIKEQFKRKVKIGKIPKSTEIYGRFS